MPAKSKSRFVWIVIAVVVVAALYWMGDGLMAWLRVTMHGR